MKNGLFLFLVLVSLLVTEARSVTPATEQFVATSISLSATVSLAGMGETLTLKKSGLSKTALLKLIAPTLSGTPDYKTLEVVYDLTNDVVEVVKKSDGTVLWTPFTFSGGLTLANNDDFLVANKLERQALLTAQGDSSPNGSIAASITMTHDHNNVLTKYAASATLQFSLKQGVLSSFFDAVFTGTVMTGKKFVPEAP